MLGTLGLALLGGLVLNVMPCVLPVLALKAFKVVDHARLDARQRHRHGIAYALGTVSLFVALALVVVAVRSSGRLLGWGMQFQHPPFVATMTAIVFVFALNAVGVFEMTFGMSRGGGDSDSLLGSFVNGLFAAIMATPCSAPFLGTAAAVALGKDTGAGETLLIFLCIGLGLALPYLGLTFVPGLSRLLPRPGAWMETVKQVMGFLLLGTAVWLLRVLQAQVSWRSASNFLVFLLVLAFALWLGGKLGGLTASTARRWTVRAAQVAMVLLAGAWMGPLERPALTVAAAASPQAPSADLAVVDGHIAWRPYDASALQTTLACQRPVFLDFTAEWCTSCKFNEGTFLETEMVRSALQRTGVATMKVDFTDPDADPPNHPLMQKFNRVGIPVYAVMLPDGTWDLLPEVITSEMVTAALDRAAARFPSSGFCAR